MWKLDNYFNIQSNVPRLVAEGPNRALIHTNPLITSARLAPVTNTRTEYGSFNNHHGVLPSNHISTLITIPRRYIDEHEGIYNTSLKDERHTTDKIKYAIQVKSLSERDRFTVIVNNRITKQNKYR